MLPNNVIVQRLFSWGLESLTNCTRETVLVVERFNMAGHVRPRNQRVALGTWNFGNIITSIGSRHGEIMFLSEIEITNDNVATVLCIREGENDL